MKRIKLLLVEDHLIVREGFCKMLESEKTCTFWARRRMAASRWRWPKIRPKVVLIDITMPGLNGLEAARQILKALPKTKNIVLSAHNDPPYIEAAINCGAVAFLSKQTTARTVCRTIRQVHKGVTFFDPLIRSRNAKGDAGAKKAGGSFELTSREREVLQLIAEGNANKIIASELGISPKTVEKHRGNLMCKLKIHDTAGLTRYAMASGLIDGGVLFKVIKSRSHGF